MVTLGTNTIKNTVTAQAPDEIPVIYGSAKGFLITACKSTPEIARLAPISTAIITLGILKSFIIPILPVLSPVNIPLINFVKLISILPNFKDINIVANNTKSKETVKTIFVFLFNIFIFYSPLLCTISYSMSKPSITFKLALIPK